MMSQQSFIRVIVPYLYRPRYKNRCGQKEDEQKNTRLEEEHFESRDSLFWRGIWMLVF